MADEQGSFDPLINRCHRIFGQMFSERHPEEFLKHLNGYNLIRIPDGEGNPKNQIFNQMFSERRFEDFLRHLDGYNQPSISSLAPKQPIWTKSRLPVSVFLQLFFHPTRMMSDKEEEEEEEEDDDDDEEDDDDDCTDYSQPGTSNPKNDPEDNDTDRSEAEEGISNTLEKELHEPDESNKELCATSGNHSNMILLQLPNQEKMDKLKMKLERRRSNKTKKKYKKSKIVKKKLTGFNSDPIAYNYPKSDKRKEKRKSKPSIVPAITVADESGENVELDETFNPNTPQEEDSENPGSHQHQDQDGSSSSEASTSRESSSGTSSSTRTRQNKICCTIL